MNISLARIDSNSSVLDQKAKNLDNLYHEQLKGLRLLILKLQNVHDVELCRKWLDIFSKTSSAEKTSRNCLCSLMYQQLQLDGYLSEPFTDIRNCNRDLNRVLNELDRQSLISMENYLETARTYTSHKHNQAILDECKENEVQMENLKLRRELESTRLIVTEQEMKISELIEIVRNCNSCRGNRRPERSEFIPEEITQSIDGVLQNLKVNQNSKIEIFSQIFSDKHAQNEYLMKKLRDYDKELQGILRKPLDQEIAKIKVQIISDVRTKVKSKKAKLIAKYEKNIRAQWWNQRVQLKMIKLKCFSLLRRIFLRIRREPDANMMELLSELEEKYKQILEEVVTNRKL